MKIQEGLSFDDVLLVPRFSEIISRNNVDVSVDLGKGIKLKIPIISSNMKSITETAMAKEIARLGGMAILHRFAEIEEQLKMYKEATKNPDYTNYIGCSVGVKKEDYIHVDLFADAGIKIIVVDVAHGHHSLCGKMTEYIAKKYPHILLISGNVATASGSNYLYDCGADIIKIFVGSGSICTTRQMTGCGVPTMKNLEDVFMASGNYKEDINNLYDQNKRRYKIIADGGIRNSGDMVKSLIFCDVLMIGNLISATNETPGKIIEVKDGKKWKTYDGSSTVGRLKNIEGVRAWAEYKGAVANVIENLIDGIRSGCSYQGVSNLIELKTKQPSFIRITNNGLKESLAHIGNIRD